MNLKNTYKGGKMLKKMIFVIIILSLIVVGCAKKKAEEVVKPEESTVITEEQPTESLEIVTEEPVISEEPILEDTTTSVQGEYKVQVFATYDEGKANKVADDLKTKINEEIYVEYIAPYYKVRIGHYATKADAEKVRDSIRDLGFSDAFIVLP